MQKMSGMLSIILRMLLKYLAYNEKWLNLKY